MAISANGVDKYSEIRPFRKAGATKIHLGHPGSSAATCGWWTKWQISRLPVATITEKNLSQCCERCADEQTWRKYIAK